MAAAERRSAAGPANVETRLLVGEPAHGLVERELVRVSFFAST